MPDRNPLEVGRLRDGLVGLDRRADSRSLLRDDFGVLDALLRPVERFAQSGLLDRLQQIVDGVDLERARPRTRRMR